MKQKILKFLKKEHKNIKLSSFTTFKSCESVNFYRIYKKSFYPNELNNLLNFNKNTVYGVYFNKENEKHNYYYKMFLIFLRTENINFYIYEDQLKGREIFINGYKKNNYNFIDKKINLFNKDYKQERYIYIN